MTPDLAPTLDTARRLELHMARGSDNVWHAWLYDPATDEIVATAVQEYHYSLAHLIKMAILPVLETY